MKKRKIEFAICFMAMLLAVTACGKQEQANNESSGDQEIQETEETQETEVGVSEEEKERLLHRIDYALLGHGPYAERALRGYLIADADNDGVEELFVDCGRETDRETLFAFDFREDGTPFGLCHANRSATGGSAFQVKHDGGPVLMSSFASMGAGTSEEYSCWNGSEWEIFAASHVVYDFDAMKYTDDPVYLSEEATYEGEALTLEAFEDRIAALQMQPISNELSSLFTVEWPENDLPAFTDMYDDHLAQLECKGILRVSVIFLISTVDSEHGEKSGIPSWYLIPIIPCLCSIELISASLGTNRDSPRSPCQSPRSPSFLGVRSTRSL